MELYLIRHAEALALGEQGIATDEERPLTEKGQAESEAAARALAGRGVVLDKLFSSPLVRARQTAEILLRVWERPELMLENCDALAPGSKPRKLSKFLMKATGDKIGLVGHMPHLADLTAWLIGGKKAQIEIVKSGVVMICCGELPAKGLCELQWLVTPDWY